MFKKLLLAFALFAAVTSFAFAASPAHAAPLPAGNLTYTPQDGWTSTVTTLADDANTRVDNSEDTTLALSDDIGEMADRIGEMADRIVVTEGLIVESETLIADTATTLNPLP